MELVNKWDNVMNFSLHGAHMPDIESGNRTLKEILCVNMYRLPFKIILRTVIKYLALRVMRHSEYFPAQTEISLHCLSHTIVSDIQDNFQQQFPHSFEDCVQANGTHSIRTNNLARKLDFIYLRAGNYLKGGHNAMDLVTRNMMHFSGIDDCAMIQMVVDRVKLMAKQQGYRRFKLFNHKKEGIILYSADLLPEVGGGV